MRVCEISDLLFLQKEKVNTVYSTYIHTELLFCFIETKSDVEAFGNTVKPFLLGVSFHKK